jgi:hypothetical protein
MNIELTPISDANLIFRLRDGNPTAEEREALIKILAHHLVTDPDHTVLTGIAPGSLLQRDILSEAADIADIMQYRRRLTAVWPTQSADIARLEALGFVESPNSAVQRQPRWRLTSSTPFSIEVYGGVADDDSFVLHGRVYAYRQSEHIEAKSLDELFAKVEKIRDTWLESVTNEPSDKGMVAFLERVGPLAHHAK